MRDISRRAGFITATLILGLLVFPIAANAAGELQPQEGDVELMTSPFGTANACRC